MVLKLHCPDNHEVRIICNLDLFDSEDVYKISNLVTVPLEEIEQFHRLVHEASKEVGGKMIYFYGGISLINIFSHYLHYSLVTIIPPLKHGKHSTSSDIPTPPHNHCKHSTCSDIPTSRSRPEVCGRKAV